MLRISRHFSSAEEWRLQQKRSNGKVTFGLFQLVKKEMMERNVSYHLHIRSCFVVTWPYLGEKPVNFVLWNQLSVPGHG